MARNRHRLGAGEDRCQDGDRDVEYRAAGDEKNKNMNNNEIQNLKEKIEADLKLLIAEIDNGTTDIWDLKNILNKIKSISIYKKD